MVLEILKGLDYLHSLPEPLIHRDLKPANILLQGEKPLIADFGLSRFIDETWSGRTLGTLAYMAPECFKSGGSRSAQTDIWSVGVVFYKLVAGHLPFPQQDPPALMNAICADDLPPLPESIPKRIQEVIRTALQKNGNDRFKSAAVMLEVLNEAAKEIKSEVDYFNSALAYLRNGEYGKAIADFDKAIELKRDYVEAYVERGKAFLDHGFLDRGNYEEAKRSFTLAINYSGKADARPHFLRGASYAKAGDRDKALRDFNQAIHIKEQSTGLTEAEADYYLYRGCILRDLEEHDRAIADIDRAIKLRPYDAEFYSERADTFKTFRDNIRTKMLADLRKALELGCRNPAAVESQIQEIEKELSPETLRCSGESARELKRTAIRRRTFIYVLVVLIAIMFAGWLGYRQWSKPEATLPQKFEPGMIVSIDTTLEPVEIGAGIPSYTLVITGVGKVDDLIPLTVTVKKGSNDLINVQKIEHPAMMFNPFRYKAVHDITQQDFNPIFEQDDLNFDGYKDLQFIGDGGTAIYKLCWLFNKSTGTFEFSERLSAVFSRVKHQALDAGAKAITLLRDQGREQTYKWENGQLVLVADSAPDSYDDESRKFLKE